MRLATVAELVQTFVSVILDIRLFSRIFNLGRGVIEQLGCRSNRDPIGGLWFGGVTSLLGMQFNHSVGNLEKSLLGILCTYVVCKYLIENVSFKYVSNRGRVSQSVCMRTVEGLHEG
jgi:hypothetical protein